MTAAPTTTTTRAAIAAPHSELGSFEVVRRLPVTTWALRPHGHVPATEPCNETAAAMHALGTLAGWLEATPWSTSVQQELSARHANPTGVSPRITTAWLGIPPDQQDRFATVPPPPSWLTSILRGWESATAAHTASPLESASWTLWLFVTTQAYGPASEMLGSAHAAQLVARGFGLPTPLVSGWPTTDSARTILQRHLANALDAERYSRWHRAWLTQLAIEANVLLQAFRGLAVERARLIEAASSMRAPRHCVLLAESLVAKPRTSVAEAATRMDLTFRAAQAIVDKFVSDQLLRETTGRKRDRLYQCDAIAAIHNSVMGVSGV